MLHRPVQGPAAADRGGSGRVEICVEAFTEGSQRRLVEYLQRDVRLRRQASFRGRSQGACLAVHHGSVGPFLEMIAPYVHPSMEYKLLARFRGQFAVEPEFIEPSQCADAHADRSIAPKSNDRDALVDRYDIEVEGTHNYFADGVMVHNSPETTTGGRALKFYSSVRLDVRRIETLKDGTDMVGNRTRVKVVKNKVAPPFKQAEFDIMYGQGISREGGLIDVGVEAGLVRKAGAWYTYEGDQLGQGKENSRAFLKDNPDLADELEKKILEKLGVGPTVDAEARRSGRPGRRRCLLIRSIAVARRCADGVRGAGRCGRTAPGPGQGPEADPERWPAILLDQLTGRARSRKELADKLASQAACPASSRPAARPVRGGRAGRRRRVRPHVGEPAPAGQGPVPTGARPGAAPQGRRRRGRRGGPRGDRPGRRGGRRPRPGPQEAALDAAASTTRSPPGAWSACWPARATRRAWRSASSVRSCSEPVVKESMSTPHDGGMTLLTFACRRGMSTSPPSTVGPHRVSPVTSRRASCAGGSGRRPGRHAGTALRRGDLRHRPRPSRASGPAGHGHLRQGWRAAAHGGPGRPAGARDHLVQGADRGRAQARLPVADRARPCRPGPDRGLRPLVTTRTCSSAACASLAPDDEIERRYDAINAFEAEARRRRHHDDQVHAAHLRRRPRRNGCSLGWTTRPSTGSSTPATSTSAGAGAEYRAPTRSPSSGTNTEVAPWYVVPSDRKWYRNLAVGRLLHEALSAWPASGRAADFDVDEQRRRLEDEAPVA